MAGEKAGRGAQGSGSYQPADSCVLTQKDTKNEQKHQASRDTVNFVPETALLLLSDDLKPSPASLPS